MYRTPLLRYMTTTFRSIPLVLDYYQESQKIKLKFFEKITTNKKPTKIEITIHSQVQIYSVRVLLETSYGGIHFLMYHYWLAFGSIVVLGLMVCETLLIGLGVRWILDRYQKQVEFEKALIEEQLASDSFDMTNLTKLD